MAGNNLSTLSKNFKQVEFYLRIIATYKCASLKRSMQEMFFAAVEDLFNSKIFGDILHKRHNECL
jgi:hypothetical protein